MHRCAKTGRRQHPCQAFVTPAQPIAAVQGVSQLLRLLAGALCTKAVQQLVDDEDDLFFESGRHMPELLAALVRPGCVWGGGEGGWGKTLAGCHVVLAGNHCQN